MATYRASLCPRMGEIGQYGTPSPSPCPHLNIFLNTLPLVHTCTRARILSRYTSRFNPVMGLVRDLYWKGLLEALRRVSYPGHMFYRPRCAKGRKVPSRASGAILRLWYACRIAVEGPRSLSGSVLRFGRLMYRPGAKMALRGSTARVWGWRGKSGLTG